MIEPRKPYLHSDIDSPITSNQQDKLARKEFVENIIPALIENGKSIGSTVGLCGEWGSGKTSILNLVEELLRSEHKDNICIVRFDPWVFSNQEDLVRHFIYELSAEIAKMSPAKSKINKENAKTLLNALGKFGNLVSGGIPISSFMDIINGFIDSPDESKTLIEIKTEINKQLADIDFSVVVMIDELDRLTDNEISEVMRLIKAVVNFDNVSYLVAYDVKRVIEALSNKNFMKEERDSTEIDESSMEKGQSYLEKIIQYQIPIPSPSQKQMDEMWRESIMQVFMIAPGEFHHSFKSYENKYLHDLELLKNLIFPSVIKTIRDIKRITGTFRTLFAINNEYINIVDILCYSILMAKYPKIIERIRNYSFFFVNIKEPLDITLADIPQVVKPQVVEKYKSNCNAYEESAESELEKKFGINLYNSITDIIGFIFPKFDQNERWKLRKALQNRICYEKNLEALLRMSQ